MRAWGWLAMAALMATGCAKTARRSAWDASVLPKYGVWNAERAADGDLELQRLRARVLAEPDDVVARVELASHYDRLGMKEIALEHYRLLGVRRPEDELAHLRLAQALRESDPETARQELKQFAGRYPVRMADTWSLLAILEDRTGALTAGEEWHRKALELAPQSDQLHNNLGYNLAQQERHVEAVKEFRRALALNAQSDVARNNLAASLAEQSGGLQQAFDTWRRVSGDAVAHNNVGALLLEKGDYCGARREFNEALRLKPGMGEAWRNLAKVSTLDGGAAEVTMAKSAPVVERPTGWRLLSDGFKKIFGTESTEAVLRPTVTEVGEGADAPSGRIKKQKSAE